MTPQERMDWLPGGDKFKRCADIIDTEWKYSWHWGKEPDKRHWTMDATHDCQSRIKEAEDDLAYLNKIRAELVRACPGLYP